MTDIIITVWFYLIFFASIYLIYISLQAFNYSKIIRPGKDKELKIILIVISVIIAFLFAEVFVTVMEKILNLTSL